MALIPRWPKAGPTGGVGVAPPDGIVNFKYETAAEAAELADFFPAELIWLGWLKKCKGKGYTN